MKVVFSKLHRCQRRSRVMSLWRQLRRPAVLTQRSLPTIQVAPNRTVSTKHLGITLTPSKRLFKEHRSRRLRKALLAVATIEYLREIQSKTTLAICYSKVVAYASYALPTIWAYLPISNDTNAIVVSLIPSSSRAFTSLLGTDCLLAF